MLRVLILRDTLEIKLVHKFQILPKWEEGSWDGIDAEGRRQSNDGIKKRSTHHQTDSN